MTSRFPTPCCKLKNPFEQCWSSNKGKERWRNRVSADMVSTNVSTQFSLLMKWDAIFMYQWIRNMFDCQNIYFDKWSPRSILKIENWSFWECVKSVTINYDHIWSICLKLLWNFLITIDENDFRTRLMHFCRHFFVNWCAWKLFMYICWEDGLLTN